MSLVRQRCHNHSAREAAARCPACHQFYCRECISEHEGRVLCATCLRAEAEAANSNRPRFSIVIHLAQFLLALFVTWLVFYWSGQTLLNIPTAFHDASALSNGWLDSR